MGEDMQICGLSKVTLLDYPEHVAATVFTGGCNFCCPFCHNGQLVVQPQDIEVLPEAEVLSFLENRRGRLSGVCITGGEPTLQEDLEQFIRKIKALGYLVKLDTNGYKPEVTERLLQEGLLDYIAMDIKNSREKYGRTAGVPEISVEPITKSVELIRKSGIPYEFRTTVVRQLHDKEDFQRIAEWLEGSRAYYLQTYRDTETVLHREFTSYSKAEMEELADIMRRRVGLVGIRGLD